MPFDKQSAEAFLDGQGGNSQASTAPDKPIFESSQDAESFLDAPHDTSQPTFNDLGSKGPSGVKPPSPHYEFTFADRAALAAQDSKPEQKLYLEKTRGKDNVRDTDSKLQVKVDGQWVDVPDPGFWAGLAAHVPEMGGAGVGAVEGGAFGAAVGGPFAPITGVVGAIIGSGVGALGGYAAKQVGKEAAGTYSKTTGEAVEAGLSEYTYGALGEVGGRLGAGVAKKALSGSLPKWLTGATDESIAQTKKAWAQGAIPPYASMAPDARKLARIEIDAEKLTGKYAKQDQRNQQYVLSETRDMLQDSGLALPMVDQIMKDLSDPHAPPFTGRQQGEILKKAVQAQVETLETHVTQAGANADKMIDARLANIDRIIDSHPAGMLADDTSDMIKNAKAQFTEAANGIYNRIHSMLGGARVVPTDGIRSEAKQLAAMLPQTSVSSAVREMSKLAQRDIAPEDAVLLKEFGIDISSDKISLKDAQRMRTILSERGGATDLTRNVVRGDHLRIAHAVDDAIQAAGEDPLAAPAIKALNEADGWYKRNIAKFKDTAIKNLVKQTKSGMPPDPQKVVNIIAAPGQTARVNTLRSVLGDGVWARVQSTHLGMVVNGATTIGETGAPLVDGMKLLKYLQKPENLSVFKAVHGDATAFDLREVATMLASRKGNLAPQVLAKGDVRAALEGLRDSEKRLDDYLKGNLLSELRDPKKTGEDVFRWAVEPGKESRITEVSRQFGANSQQMAEMRQGALEMLSRNANIKSINDRGNKAIENALNEFTETQRKLLFPGEMEKDLRKLSETIRFIYPFKSGESRDVGMAGMHAGHVLEMPVKQRLYKQGVAAIMRLIVLHPTFARWIVTGRDPGTPWIYRSAQIIKQLVKNSMLDEENGQPEAQHQNPEKAAAIQAAKAQADGTGGSGPDDQGTPADAGSGGGKAGRKTKDNRSAGEAVRPQVQAPAQG